MVLLQEKAPTALKETDKENVVVVIDNIDRPAFDLLQELSD